MRRLFVLAVGAVAFAALNPAPARAQGLATTTFVSGGGLDSNPCTVTAPCRSFQHAHDQTAAGGQITMLDPAGYGRLTITKAISIVNDGGGEAGISDPGNGVDAITITAGASDVVTLRGLTLNGVGTGQNGINVTAVGTLNIQNCRIRGFANVGITVMPAASASVTIADTIASNNGFAGVSIIPSSGTTSAYLERVTAIGNIVEGIGLSASGAANILGTIVDSAAIRTGDGFVISVGSAGSVTLINSQAIGNANGVGLAVNPGPVVLSRMTLAGNLAGFAIFAGTLQTFGDNYIIDTNNSGTLTPIAAQ